MRRECHAIQHVRASFKIAAYDLLVQGNPRDPIWPCLTKFCFCMHKGAESPSLTRAFCLERAPLCLIARTADAPPSTRSRTLRKSTQSWNAASQLRQAVQPPLRRSRRKPNSKAKLRQTSLRQALRSRSSLPLRGWRLTTEQCPASRSSTCQAAVIVLRKRCRR